jgi:hypothetical protein
LLNAGLQAEAGVREVGMVDRMPGGNDCFDPCVGEALGPCKRQESLTANAGDANAHRGGRWRRSTQRGGERVAQPPASYIISLIIDGSTTREDCDEQSNPSEQRRCAQKRVHGKFGALDRPRPLKAASRSQPRSQKG